MSKCPFWSNKRSKVSCDSDCPMYPQNKNEEECLFMEHLSEDTVLYKDIVEEDYSYSKNDKIDFKIGSYDDY